MSHNKITPYLFLAPALVLFLVFTAYPIVASFVLSFQKLEGGQHVFNGVANYVRLSQDTVFFTALQNTLIFLIIQVPIMLGLALILAAALNNPLLKLRGFFALDFSCLLSHRSSLMRFCFRSCCRTKD